MSADFGTEITVEGNAEELFAVLEILRMFTSGKNNGYIFGYIFGVRINGTDLENLSGEKTEEFLKAARGKLEVAAEGPFGHFFVLSDVGLFEALADAAPGAKFSGRSWGFNTGADLSLDAELIDNKLFLSESNVPNEAVPEAYYSYVVEKLPFDKFCELFKVDKSEFDEDSYEEFIYDSIYDGAFSDMDHDCFMSYCEASTIEPEEYLQVMKGLNELQLDYETFQASFDYDDYVEKWIYDPIKKIRIQ